MNKTFKLSFFIKGLLGLTLMLLTIVTNGQTVNSWLTTSDKSSLLSNQGALNFASGSGATISINSGTTFQSMDGFGFCLTDGSAEVINNLAAAQQSALLNELFDPNSGIGVSVLRVSIGASDLSSYSYSYDDAGPDPSLTNFSLNGPTLSQVVPLLKKILAINPNIKILGTPWSAPKWMKTNNAWVGGSLQGAYYGAYANYLVKYLQAMKAQGINIWAITVQNEPENPYNEPSMVMNATEQTTFINNNLGPSLQSASITTKIIAYDHNCDDTSYPTQVLNGSSYVDGAAFHLYAGNVSALSTVHNATGKNVYFTEQWTSSTGSFGGDFPWHMQNVMIGSAENWGKAALEWNLANDAGFGPHTPGGCTMCLGAITVNNSTSYTKNVAYYIVGQMSKFVKQGAIRIQSSNSNGSLSQVAFRNPDGSIALVVYNSGGGQNISVGYGSNIFNAYIPASSAVTYVWSNGIPSTTGLVTAYKDCNYAGSSGGLTVGDYTTAQLNALGILDNDISSIKITEGYKAIIYDNDNFGGASVEVTADNSCLAGISWNDKIGSIKIRTNGATNMAGTYFLQNRNSGLYMDVSGGPGSVNDGDNIQQWTLANGDNQKFEFIHLGDGTYEVLAFNSKKSLDVEGGVTSTNDGRNVQQWTYYGSANQQYIVFPTGDGYYKLIAKHSGKLVEVAGASMADGGNVQQWTNNNQTCGQWNFKPLIFPYSAGDGIRADYFNGQNFDTWKTTKKENNINFDWGNGSPDVSVNADDFSARWTGKIQPRYTGTYTFYINSDNGRRLWINNQLIIDKWLNDWGVEYSGTIALEAGKKYDIVFEFFEASGGASSKFEWSSSSQPREVVPQGQLYANVAPSVSITAPANNANYVATANITINATAADADGSVTKVEFYNGTTKLGEDASSPYSYNWTNVGVGTYTIIARAIDNQGVFTNTSTSVKVNANQNPTVSITSPANNATFTSPASVSITATASDADGTIAKVEFYNGTTLLGSSTSNPYTYTWTGVTAGTYTITAKATDDKGGVTTSVPIIVVVNNPNVAPNVNITAPVNNATYVASANISITTAANDADGSISKVEFYNGTTLLGTVSASPYTYNWTNVGMGTYSLTAKAYDNLGLSKTSTAIAVKVNANQNPTVSITAPSNNASFTSPASINISATASDADGTIAKVEFYNGTTLLGATTTNLYSYNWTGVPAGSYTLTAKATDDKGGVTTSAPITVKVNNPNGAPSISITSPLNNTTYVASANVTITSNATDADGSISKVEYYNGASLLGTVTSSPYNYNWTGVIAGTYSLTAKAYDNLGLSTVSSAVTFIVNVNQIPTVGIDAISTSSNTITINVNATDGDGSITKVEYYDGNTKIGESVSSPYSFTYSNVSAGVHNIHAVAFDDKGGSNTSSTISVQVDNPNQSPVVTITLPLSNAIFNAPADIIIEADATDSDGSISKVEFYNGSTKLGESTSAPYSFNWINVAEGTYTIGVLATDNKGLTDDDQIVLVVQRNTTAVVGGRVDNGFIIYPNPTQGLINLNKDVKAVNIYSLTGKPLQYVQLNGQNNIDLSAYPSGMYLIQLVSESETNFIKITKE